MAIEAHEWLNSFANSSPTVACEAGEGIAAPAHKAAMYDGGGGVALADSGEKAMGIILAASPDPIGKGMPAHVLIKDIGLLEAGGPIAKGDPVTVVAGGLGAKASPGDFVFGWAHTAAEKGACAQVQITRSGRMA